MKIQFRLSSPLAPGSTSPATANHSLPEIYRKYTAARDPESGVFFELWRFVRRHPIRIVTATVLGILLSAAYTIPQTRVYQATATLEIQEMNENFMDFKDALPVSENHASGASTGMQTQLRILTSYTLLSRVLDKLPQEQTPPESPLRKLRRRLTHMPLPPPPDREALVDRARQNLSVRDTRQTRIVDLSYDSPDPTYAAAFVNTLAQEYIEQNVETRWKMSQQTADFLSRQLGEMRKKLADSEDRLQIYARRSGLLFTAEKQNPSEEKLRQVQENLSKAQEERMAKQALWETSQNTTPEGLAEVLNDVSLRDYQNKLTDLRRQRAELGTVFKPNFDLVKRLDAQISTLEGALKTERAAILQRIHNDYESAVRHETLLENSYAAQSDLVSREGEKAVQYTILQREVDSNRQLYEMMLHKVNETSIASALRASNVRIVDTGKAPRMPYKPSMKLNLLWGITAGLLTGMALAVLSERSDRRFRHPGDLGHCLSVPELGSVPSANGALAGKIGYTRSLAPEFNTAAPAGQACIELVAWQQRSSLMAESFRAILTSILFSNGEGNSPKVVVVTSALPSEGKTTVSSNMAAAMARIGRRVLLIDADLRRPRLHQVFHVSQDYGLFDLLTSGSKDYRDLLPYVIQESSIPGAYLLVGGPLTANATDLLYSETMADLLRQARHAFDMVIIDTPPMLDLPDARVLGRMSDGVVLVVRAGATTRDIALTVKRRLQEDNITLLGTVLNNWIPN
jgi:capsular exopolysaccharide synthesis family protein